MNDSWLVEKVPVWAHPRSPLVAISLRVGGPWEYRVNRFIDFVLTQVFSIWIIIFVFLPLFGALLFAAGWQFFSILTYVALTLSAPFMVFASEFLFLRLWAATPVRSSDLIAGEIQRRTWDIIRSTPYPRHQLVLAKFASMIWMAEPTLLYIVVMRSLFVLGLFTFRFMEQPSPATPGWILWGVVMLVSPCLEIFAIFSIGLFISSVTSSPRQANLLALITQAAYRLLVIALLISLFADFSTPFFAPLIAIPHWTLLPLGHGDFYSATFLAGLIILFVVMPIGTGSTLIWLTVRRVQNQ